MTTQQTAQELSAVQKIEVKQIFHGVSINDKKLIMTKRYNWDRVLHAEVMPVSAAKELYKDDTNKVSILNKLEEQGTNGVVVAKTTVLSDDYLNNPRTPHPERAIKTVLAPVI